jgi:hypothetical protein
MSWIYLRRTDPTVDALVKAAFPGYRGQHVVATITDRVRFSGTQWCEGNKCDYAIVHLGNLKVHHVGEQPFLEHSKLHEDTFAIPDGVAVVCHSRGRWEHIEIIAPPTAITPLLPAPVELTWDEQVVLTATCGLKSSYNGISNYRYHQAKRYTGITPEAYEAARASLIARKLLTKAGAATPEARNLRPCRDLSDLARRRPAALEG